MTFRSQASSTLVYIQWILFTDVHSIAMWTLSIGGGACSSCESLITEASKAAELQRLVWGLVLRNITSGQIIPSPGQEKKISSVSER